MFFCVTAYRYTAGYFVISGRVWIAKEDGRGYSPAVQHEVQIGERSFATNKNGQYFIVLPAMHYYATVLGGNTDLTIVDADGPRDESFPTDFEFLTRNFADVKLKRRDAAVVAQQPPAPPRHSFFELEPSAYAEQKDVPKWPYDRLYVEQVTLSGNSKARSARLELDLGKKEQDLLSNGTRTGEIQLLAGESVDFGTQYYFPIPQNRTANFSATVELDGGGIWPFGYDEDFQIDNLPALGQARVITGGKGSRIVVRMMTAIDVYVAVPPALAEATEKLRAEYQARGVRVITTNAPKPPNFMSVGYHVPEPLLKDLIASLERTGYSLKDVKPTRVGYERYEMSFAYSDAIEWAKRATPEEAERFFGTLLGGRRD